MVTMSDPQNLHCQERFENVLMNLSWQLAYARQELTCLANSVEDIPKPVRIEIEAMARSIDHFRDSPGMRVVRDSLAELIERAQDQRNWDQYDQANEEAGSIPNPANDAD